MNDQPQPLTTAIAAATGLALRYHQDQKRKGTDIPYISHLLHVAAYAMEDGADEESVIAALLHDAAEDQGGRTVLAEIASQFGPKVARIVEDCSDSLSEDSKLKAPWQQRKEATIAALPSMQRNSLVVIAADKLHNVRATADDVRLGQEDVWDRFKTGMEGFIWYHEEVWRVLDDLLPNSRSVRLLRSALDEIR